MIVVLIYSHRISIIFYLFVYLLLFFIDIYIYYVSGTRGLIDGIGIGIRSLMVHSLLVSLVPHKGG